VAQSGRDDLLQWREAKPSNYFATVLDLESVLELRMGRPLDLSTTEDFSSFGLRVATVIEPAVQILERNREFPKLRPYDELGVPIDEIEFHPANDVAARAAWASGMLATRLDFHGAFELATKFLLLSHVGEGGQACPIVCTIGMRRAIEHRASGAIKDLYLAGLTGTDASSALRGSQFLTEVQGGSDVGANVTRAVPDEVVAGAWRISGEKWFCSVADADLFAVTARPDGALPGTKGLACFVIPRSLDGVSPNGFRLRRLKDKLGTRALASAEIDFDNALAFPIGELDQGFNIAVSELLNTSRWLNAVGSVGIMCRSYLEASTFARHREAFGVVIATYPAVREQLALIKAETAAALASTMALTELVGRIDEGAASPKEIAVHRFLVNANKYVTSIAASDIVHRAIEILGGNGTIEDFSPLPRLYRDAVVFESWEGTHNVLCAQVQRDCIRLGLLSPVREWVLNELSMLSAPDSSGAQRVKTILESLQEHLTTSLMEPAPQSANFRRQLTTLMDVIQATCLLREADQASASDEKSAIAALFIERHLVPDTIVTPPVWTRHVDEVLGATFAL
jgi:alkylation response protein AidB-like acyl-CoA dehydrogenase